MNPRTPLEHILEHERTRSNDVWLTQPIGSGGVRDFTFAQAIEGRYGGRVDDGDRSADHVIWA